MSSHLQITGEFDAWVDAHAISQRWSKWYNKFKQFTAASGITNSAQQRQLLLYTAGDALNSIVEHEILESTTGETLEDLNKAILGHFNKKDNVVFTRYQFNLCKQEDGESIDQWYTRLRQAAEG